MQKFALVNIPVMPLYEKKAETVITENGVATGVGDECLYGSPVVITEGEEGWLRCVTYYGYAGYIHSDNVVFVKEETIAAYEAADLRVIINRCTDALTMPSVKGARILELPGGAIVRVIADREDGWSEILLINGEKAFVPTAFTEKKQFDFEFIHRDAEKTEEILAEAAQRKKDTKGGCGFDLNAFIEKKYGGSEERFRAKLVDSAKNYLGVQYRWAGRSALGIDCSGMVSSAYMRAGVIIYRDSALADGFPLEKIEACNDENGAFRLSAVIDGTLKEGDALYFPGHIGMYIGKGKYLHSTGRKGDNGVVETSLIEGDENYREDLLKQLYAVGGLR